MKRLSNNARGQICILGINKENALARNFGDAYHDSSRSSLK